MCFILSGVMKAINVYSFAQEIRLYLEAYMNSFFLQWTAEIAVVICMAETVVGLLALRKEFVLFVSVVFLTMLSFFVWLTGINLFYPSIMGSIESCGCFGELVHFSAPASFVKSVVLWALALGLLGLCAKDIKKTFKKIMLFHNGNTYVALLTGVMPPVYSYLCFENMEHSYYLIGYISLCIILFFLLGYCYANRK